MIITNYNSKSKFMISFTFFFFVTNSNLKGGFSLWPWRNVKERVIYQQNSRIFCLFCFTDETGTNLKFIFSNTKEKREKYRPV